MWNMYLLVGIILYEIIIYFKIVNVVKLSWLFFFVLCIVMESLVWLLEIFIFLMLMMGLNWRLNLFLVSFCIYVRDV